MTGLSAGSWQVYNISEMFTALAIAKKWLDAHFPGSEIEETYTFPGYYTIHFTTPDGDMQMISVSGYNGAVMFHWWHGHHISDIKISN